VGSARALAAAVVVVAVAGCGGRTASGPPGCLRVYFDPGATQAQIDAVGARFYDLSDKIASLRFVSKRTALAEMRRRHPEMTRDMPYNPFPASFRVNPKSREDGEAILRAFRPSPQSVHAVKYARSLLHC
jgi:cell division protein FtsX